MIKTCGICGHIGELTWRDGNYYCAMCGSRVEETQPAAKPQSAVHQQVSNAECPICKNSVNNVYQNGKYRCGMCGTWFELVQPAYEPRQNTYNTYSSNTRVRGPYYDELMKTKNKNFRLGVLFVFLFWPASIYFFYKYNKAKNELKAYSRY